MSESVLAIADYVQFLTTATEPIPGRSYQNFFVAQTRNWGEMSYLFGPMGFEGDASVRGGETRQAVLVAASNGITVALFSEAAKERYMLQVDKVSIRMIPGSPPDFEEELVLARYIWAVSGFERPPDDETVRLVLTGARNAVDRQVPSARLTSDRVGAMPATGNIYTS